MAGKKRPRSSEIPMDRLHALYQPAIYYIISAGNDRDCGKIDKRVIESFYFSIKIIEAAGMFLVVSFHISKNVIH